MNLSFFALFEFSYPFILLSFYLALVYEYRAVIPQPTKFPSEQFFSYRVHLRFSRKQGYEGKVMLQEHLGQCGDEGKPQTSVSAAPQGEKK
jgi:hypothetical protein